MTLEELRYQLAVLQEQRSDAIAEVLRLQVLVARATTILGGTDLETAAQRHVRLRSEMLTLTQRLSTVLDKHRIAAVRYLQMHAYMDADEQRNRGADARDCRDLLALWDAMQSMRQELLR